MKRTSSPVLTAVAALLLIFIVTGSAWAAGSRYGANYFPNVTLTTHEGKTVRFYDDLLKGKIVAIDLIYTHCKDMCPLETAKLAQVQKMLGDRVGKDIFFYSISIDPKADTPEVMKAYADKFHAGPGWLFLTGKKEDIDLISNKLGLTSVTDKETREGHKPSLMIGNEPAGMWMRNTAIDNPRFLALTITNLLTTWTGRKVEAAKTNSQGAPLVQAKGQHFAGQYLFGSRCAACHTLGNGDKIGPDLLGVTRVRDHAWLLRFIAHPDEVLAAKDPIATALFEKYKQVTMPNMRLSEEDAAAIIDFLKDQTASSAAKAHAEVAGNAAADQAASVNTHKSVNTQK